MKKKKALGRGLSALFESDSSSKSVSPPKEESNNINKNGNQDYQLIDLELIRTNPNQPRSYFDEDKLKELANSIKNFGIIEPIIVSQKISSEKKTYYEVIAGERRLRASKIAGLTTIPSLIKNDANENLLEVMLIENLQREDLTALEEAQSYETIIDKKNITQDQLADLIGKSRSYITNMMRILKAPLNVKKQLAENLLTVSQVRTLMSLPEKEMTNLAYRAVKENLSVRELEKIVNQINKQKPSTSKTSKTSKNPITKDPNISEIEQMYRDRLKTKVTIKPLKNKKGKIEVEYYNYDELLGILDQIKQ